VPEKKGTASAKTPATTTAKPKEDKKVEQIKPTDKKAVEKPADKDAAAKKKEVKPANDIAKFQ
jgi:hypothetical protein